MKPSPFTRPDDFLHHAAPWLSGLKDDPNKPNSIWLPNPTTFPATEIELDAELRPLPPDGSALNQDSNRVCRKEGIEAARAVYPMAGLDVLAFYKSFRFKDLPPFSGTWGIYLLDAGVAGLAADFQALNPRRPASELEKLAIDLLIAHERYHFWIDAWTLGQEITPLDENLRFKRYVYYFAAKREVELTGNDWEESLANHYAFNALRQRKLSDKSTALKLLRNILEKGPVPYSDFTFDMEERAEKEGRLASAAANGEHGSHLIKALVASRLRGLPSPALLSSSIEPGRKNHPITGWIHCPVYHVITANYTSLVQPYQGPKRPEFRDFITAYLRGTSLQRTDHEYYQIDNGEKIRFPNPHYNDVLGHELKGTLAKAGMTPREFLDARIATRQWSRNCPRQEVKPPRK